MLRIIDDILWKLWFICGYCRVYLFFKQSSVSPKTKCFCIRQYRFFFRQWPIVIFLIYKNYCYFSDFIKHFTWSTLIPQGTFIESNIRSISYVATAQKVSGSYSKCSKKKVYIKIFWIFQIWQCIKCCAHAVINALHFPYISFRFEIPPYYQNFSPPPRNTKNTKFIGIKTSLEWQNRHFTQRSKHLCESNSAFTVLKKLYHIHNVK